MTQLRWHCCRDESKPLRKFGALSTWPRAVVPFPSNNVTASSNEASGFQRKLGSRSFPYWHRKGCLIQMTPVEFATR